MFCFYFDYFASKLLWKKELRKENRKEFEKKRIEEKACWPRGPTSPPFSSPPPPPAR